MGPVGHLGKSALDNEHHVPLGRVYCFFVACAVTIVCLSVPFESLLSCHEADKRCRVPVILHFVPEA